MLRIQYGRVAKAWEHAELRRWLKQRFPDHCFGKPKAELDDFLDRRAGAARALGFDRASHLQYLIDYELGSGLAVLDPDAEIAAPEIRRVLAQKDVDPDQRIEAAERLLFGGEVTDGSSS